MTGLALWARFAARDEDAADQVVWSTEGGIGWGPGIAQEGGSICAV